MGQIHQVPRHPIVAYLSGLRAFGGGMCRVSGNPGVGKSRLLFALAGDYMRYYSVFRESLITVFPTLNNLVAPKCNIIVGYTEEAGLAYLHYLPAPPSLIVHLRSFADLVALHHVACQYTGPIVIIDSLVGLSPIYFGQAPLASGLPLKDEWIHPQVEAESYAIAPEWPEGVGKVQIYTFAYQEKGRSSDGVVLREGTGLGDEAAAASRCIPFLHRYGAVCVTASSQTRTKIGSGFSWQAVQGGKALNFYVNPDISMSDVHDLPLAATLSVTKTTTARKELMVYLNGYKGLSWSLLRVLGALQGIRKQSFRGIPFEEWQGISDDDYHILATHIYKHMDRTDIPTLCYQ